jgi:hypothetical protein
LYEKGIVSHDLCSTNAARFYANTEKVKRTTVANDEEIPRAKSGKPHFLLTTLEEEDTLLNISGHFSNVQYTEGGNSWTNVKG